MRWAILQNGSPVEVFDGQPLVIDDVQYSLDIFKLAMTDAAGWSVAALEALGVYQVQEPAIPAHQHVASSALVWTGTAVELQCEFADDDLVARKVTMKEAVDSQAAACVSAGIVFMGHLFQTRKTETKDDRENIAGAVTWATLWKLQGGDGASLRWANPDADFKWIAADNTLVSITADQMIEFGMALAAFKSRCVFYAFGLKAEIDAAVDHAALDAINIAAGWPSNEV